jgi:hypothetical protein
MKTALLRLARSQTISSSRAPDPAAAASVSGVNGVAEWCAALAARGLDASDLKLTKFNATENVIVWPDHCVAASLGEPPLSDRDKLRHSGVELVVFPTSNHDWSAALDQLVGLLRG